MVSIVSPVKVEPVRKGRFCAIGGTTGPAARQAVPRTIALTALATSIFAIAANAAPPALPVPCATGSCGAAGPSKFITAGAATAVATPRALNVNQTSSSAILNWSSFDVGAGGAVNFKQPSTNAIALNRIYQGSPSRIFGSLTANGQVYLVNQNGFVFGATSIVNVGSLLASSLPLALSDAQFGSGILSPLQNSKAVFDATLDTVVPGGRASVVDANGNPVNGADGKPLAVQVVVQPGAQLTAADQGRLLLAGQSVTNGGSLSAPDGQVILAAGAKVYLQADTDPGLRGLVVEVDQGGKAWNQLGGLLSAPRGNVTLVGLAVNQDGRISASTSVSANGSIRLEAADTAFVSSSGGTNTVASTHGGALTIGSQSQLEILPELSSSATGVDAQKQLSSTVALLGEQVIVQGGTIRAPNGSLTAIAALDPSPAAANPAGGVSATVDPNARVRIDAGTTIDLSGSTAALPVTANLVAVQLRSGELADDPSQRNGPLHGLTVYVDRRLGSPPIADLSSDFLAVPQTIAQRTEKGGQAIFQSEGDVVFASGATLNVSGGASTYASGVLQTSELVGTNGRLYPIATADPLLSYTGVVNPTFTQTYNTWGVQDIVANPSLSNFQPGYVQGAAAGSVQFVAPTMVLQGNLLGGAVNGIYQRTPSTVSPGATLTLGLPAGAGASASTFPIDYISPPVRLTSSPIPVVVSDNAGLPGPLTLDVPTAYLTSSGFTNIQIYGDYGVTVPAGTPLVLPSGSTLAITASRVDVLSNITDSGGTLNFQNSPSVGSAATSSGPIPAAGRAGVFIGDGVTLDVRGRWTNDFRSASVATPSVAVWQNGGSITTAVTSNGALLSIGNDVSLQVGGGAWLNAKGGLVLGTGGTIALSDNALAGGVDVGNNTAISGFGVNGSSGGTFNFTAPRIEVVASDGGWARGQSVDDALKLGSVFKVTSALFSDDGFQNLNLNASGQVAPGAPNANLMSVDAGVTLTTALRSLSLSRTLSLESSAANLETLGTLATPLPYQRPPANVTLSALPPTSAFNLAQTGETSAGDVAIGRGASISTDVGGSITLTSLDSIIVDGALRAPGGAVSLHLLSPSVNGGSYQGFEAGFLPLQRIELGPNAAIDVAGAFVPQASLPGLTRGSVAGGGSVALFADRGAVVTDPGSLISVAGTTAALDVLQATGSYGHEIAATAGGSIAVHSGESISLLGTIDGAAGGPGTSGTAAAGSLDLALTRSESWWGVVGSTTALASFSTYPLTVQIGPSVARLAPSSASSNQAVLGAAQLAESGLDSLRVESGNSVLFSDNINLAFNRQFVLDAPILASAGGTRASVAAPYVEVGYELAGSAVPPSVTATGGSGILNFSGAQIDLVGPLAVQGSSQVSFSSSGDLLLRGQALGSGTGTLIGSITVAGDLALNASRIYPATATNFSVVTTASPGRAGSVMIVQIGSNPGTPFSAGGTLSVQADTILSTGSLYAPFGAITLEAGSALTLGDGSTTSVSGGGLTFPYGQTRFGGQQWIYAFNTGPQPVAGVPSRAVNLTAPTVTLGAKATIDLTGGGDLAAFEFVPGSGGTQDRLTSDSSVSGFTRGLYAILPSTLGSASPQDPQNANGSTIGPDERLFVSGGGGLAPGVYPLLPPRYALAPGAFLVQLEPQLQSVAPGLLGALSDGTPLVSGFLTSGSTGLHQTPGYIAVAIHPGSYATQLAEYDLRLASSFFSAVASAAAAPRPALPADAGSLTINVSTALNAAGSVLTAAAPGGLAAPISISASDLVIGNAAGLVPADAVSIPGSVLAGWKPGSLLLGGTAAVDGSSIDVLANTVTVGGGTAVTADQIVLVANQSINLEAGASLQSTSAGAGASLTKLPKPQSIALLGTPGATPALLAVSDLNWLTPQRSAGVPAAGAGTVAVAPNATIASRGSLSLDGIGGVTLGGTLNGGGAEWSLGSSSIAFVPANQEKDALSIGPAVLGAMTNASAVRLASTGSIDIFAPVSLGVGASGTPTLQSLTLAASSLNDMSAGGAGVGSSAFGGRTLRLQGTGASAPAALGGADTLSLVADTFEIGAGMMAITGFGATRASVSGSFIGAGAGTGTGTGGSLSVGGDLAIAASRVTAAAGSQTSIGATGALTILPTPNGVSSADPLPVGGALLLSGANVDIAGSVIVPSGIIKIAANSNLSVDQGALLDTAGALVTIGSQTVSTPGGTLALSARNDLALSQGAILDVAGAGTAAGGVLSLSAGGTASVAAGLRGTGGSFALDAGSLIPSGGVATGGVAALAANLASGGFTNSIDVRTRAGDLALTPGSAFTANSVTLTADAGQILIGGDVTAASGALRGSISIFAGDGVELAAGGSLHADGAGATGLGGTIELGVGRLLPDQAGLLGLYNGGSIRLDAGSIISTRGAAGMGTLLLRAPALIATNDVAVSALLSDTTAVGRIVVEPVLPFNTANTAIFASSIAPNMSAPTATDFQQVQQAVANYMNLAGPAIAARLAPGAGVPLMVQPGVEIIAPGALTLQSGDGVSPALDLSPAGTNWRFNGAPVDLTIRAAGDITVANTISDGFGSQAVGGLVQPTLLQGPSAAIRLVAGADLMSANPLAAVTDGAGTVTFGLPGATAALVRTGSGEIDVIAAKDIVIGNAGSGAYTAGTPAVAPGGTAADPYSHVPTKLGVEQFSLDANGNPYGIGVSIPRTSLLMSFPAGGGQLLVRAGEDISAVALDVPGVSNWQLREGGARFGGLPISSEWGVNLNTYNWSFGTLGGGDLRISAGRDLLNVTAAAADSLLPRYGGSTRYVTGGGLAVTAGGNLGSAQLFLADGTGSVTASGALTAILPSANSGEPNVGSAFYLQSSTISVTSRLGMSVGGVFNPTGLGQVSAAQPLAGSFLSYSDTSALSLMSIAGDIDLGTASAASKTLLGQTVSLASATAYGPGVLPGSLAIAAPGGAIAFGPGIGNNGATTLAPSPVGQLDLIAAGDITSDPNNRLAMSDAPPGSFATIAAPLGGTDVRSFTAQFDGNIHASDPIPALISSGGSINELLLSIPKAGRVEAAQDIVDLTYLGQNLNTTDATSISAGRDFTYLNSYGAGLGISVGGPGRLDLLAGRTLSLGFSQGVVTTGNLVNANLSSAHGADLTVATGLASNADYAGFLAKIVAPSSAYEAQLISYVQGEQGSTGLTFAAAQTAFLALPVNLQRPLIDDVFFNELLLSGRAANNTPKVGFSEGYAAIDALFPESRSAAPGYVPTAYAGDLTLAFSRLYTLSGGNISLLVPGGLLNVGLASPPSTLASRLASTLGIVAQGAGNVDIYTRGNVDVNASRIFTLGGGNIFIWSDEGSIDAGRGAKSAVSAPPPSVQIASNGTITIDYSGAAAGSGIRTIQTNPALADGNVDLVAPQGTVNAGDAGIGAAGNINIAARSVVGLDNIQFGGTATGVPAQVSSVSASLSGAAGAASSATNTSTSSVASSAAEKEAAAPLSQAALSWLDVFVTGLGEENCKPNDIECLKRQRTAH